MTFKTIARAPRFEINQQGVVRRRDTKITREHQFNKKGYPFVTLQLQPGRGSKCFKCFIHVALAKNFIENPKPEEYDIVMHLDDDVSNYSLGNLKWGTQKQNMEQSSATGHYSTVKKEVTLISPEGEEVYVTGLRTFCAEQGLDWGNFNRMVSQRVQVRGGRPRYTNSVKGWRLKSGTGVTNQCK